MRADIGGSDVVRWMWFESLNVLLHVAIANDGDQRGSYSCAHMAKASHFVYEPLPRPPKKHPLMHAINTQCLTAV